MAEKMRPLQPQGLVDVVSWGDNLRDAAVWEDCFLKSLDWKEIAVYPNTEEK